MPINVQLGLAVTESERDLGKTHRLAGVGAVENDVRHLVAAKRLGRLLPKHPANSIKHVGFSTAIGPDNGGDAFVKIKNRFVGKRFEAEQLE